MNNKFKTILYWDNHLTFRRSRLHLIMREREIKLNIFKHNQSIFSSEVRCPDLVLKYLKLLLSWFGWFIYKIVWFGKVLFPFPVSTEKDEQ